MREDHQYEDARELPSPEHRVEEERNEERPAVPEDLEQRQRPFEVEQQEQHGLEFSEQNSQPDARSAQPFRGAALRALTVRIRREIFSFGNVVLLIFGPLGPPGLASIAHAA